LGKDILDALPQNARYVFSLYVTFAIYVLWPLDLVLLALDLAARVDF
jgi:hypothetical protein